MKRTNVLYCVVSLCALVFFGLSVKAQGQTADQSKNILERLKAYPDLIVVNGKIASLGTNDKQMTPFEAMAVRDHRIVALGTTADIRSLAGPKTEILDAKGRRVLPGLIDGHTHSTRFASDHWLGEEPELMMQKYGNPSINI